MEVLLDYAAIGTSIGGLMTAVALMKQALKNNTAAVDELRKTIMKIEKFLYKHGYE